MEAVRRNAGRVVTVAVIVGLVIVELVSYFSLNRYAKGLDSLPSVVMEEFPGIDRALLDKFTSFDSELGWSPQPNMEKQKDTGDHLPGEEVRSVVTYSTDEYGSRVCPAVERDSDRDGDGNRNQDEAATDPASSSGSEGQPASRSASSSAAGSESVSSAESAPSVSTYGDSYCFCREVNDDETFQNYLAETLDTHVGNYGGGNYGIDQALMRLKQQYPEDSTDYVMMYVTASSIARILSVWKHYQEFGNILAVKPRYTFENGSLGVVESPIDEKEELLDLEAHADVLRTNDYHYEHWFKPHYASFPYTTDFLKTPDNVRYVLYTALKDIEQRFEIDIPGIDLDARQSQTTLRLEQPRVEYHKQLFDEHADLFAAIVDEFVSYAHQEDFTPVFVMVQQMRYAKHEEHGPIYRDLLDRVDEEHSELMTVDMAEHLDPEGDIESLYVQHGEGGHYSPETNERIADILAEEVFER